ncbi:hypothetical protein PybrP1_003759 [[Pythium] brassicae (nom. inval.)]|nr:hypothetical protein PybrP1_003759 [[Pythium] brassicae (nom. inval.)]
MDRWIEPLGWTRARAYYAQSPSYLLLGGGDDQREAREHRRPRARALDERAHLGADLADRHAHLLARVALAQRHHAGLHRVKVDGHRERDAELVRARVLAADRDARRVDLAFELLVREHGLELGRKRLERGVRAQRQHRDLDRRDRRVERHYAALLVALARVVVVLEDRREEAADAERRLNHRRDELLLAHHLLDDLERHHVARERELLAVAERAERGLARGRERALERERALDVVLERLERLADRREVGLEDAAHLALVRLDLDDLALLRLVELVRADHLDLALLGVHREVVARAVRVARTLDPARAQLDLEVPAVGRIVRHLRVEVLAEPEPRHVDPDRDREQRRAREVVRERLVRDHALRDRVAARHAHRLAVRELVRLCEQRELERRDLVELGVALVLRVHKELDLGLLELAHAQQARARRDLVPERRADLRAAERDLPGVVLE